MDLCGLVTQILKHSECSVPCPTPTGAYVPSPQTKFIKTITSVFSKPKFSMYFSKLPSRIRVYRVGELLKLNNFFGYVCLSSF